MISVYVVDGLIDRVESSSFSRLFLNGVEVALPRDACIFPGFVDTHCHLIGPGMMAERVDLRDARSAHECAERIAAEARLRSPGEWILGFGWNQQNWTTRSSFDRHALDVITPENPVALYRIDTHAAFVNTAALNVARLGPESAIEGGEVVLDHEGQTTGLLIDDAVKVLETAMPTPTPEMIARWYKYGVQECLRYGLTEVHDMTVAPEWLQPMSMLADRGDMKIRCRAFLDGKYERWTILPKPTVLGPNLDSVGVKFFSDGALGSRGAYLLEPYSDDPNTVGIATITREELVEGSREPIKTGYGIATHAIGDGANRLVLDAYQQLRADYPNALLRVEHAQIVHPDDVPRFAELNAIPTIQATHCTSDAAMAEERLGSQRCASAYGWKSLLDTGRPLLGGSDFPIESPDPLLGLRAFVHREATSGPWYPEQRVSRQVALQAYTEWAGLGVPGKNNRGKLVPGYDADITVLSADPIDDSDATVLCTVVNGEIQYRA